MRHAHFAIVPLVWLVHCASGPNLEALSKEANASFVALSTEFTQWVEAEAVMIENDRNPESARARLERVETANARWDALRAVMLAALDALDRRQTGAADRVQDALATLVAFVRALRSAP